MDLVAYIIQSRIEDQMSRWTNENMVSTVVRFVYCAYDQIRTFGTTHIFQVIAFRFSFAYVGVVCDECIIVVVLEHNRRRTDSIGLVGVRQDQRSTWIGTVVINDQFAGDSHIGAFRENVVRLKHMLIGFVGVVGFALCGGAQFDTRNVGYIMYISQKLRRGGGIASGVLVTFGVHSRQVDIGASIECYITNETWIL